MAIHFGLYLKRTIRNKTIQADVDKEFIYKNTYSNNPLNL